MVTEHLLITITSCIVPTMRENRFLLFLNHLRLPYSIPKSFALLLAFHCARHSFAVNILNNGANIKTVASLLGHSGLKHTEKYTRAVDKLKEDAINSLPELKL